MGWKAKIESYDEQALVDLTSVGLLRRAHKQVDAGAVRILAAEGRENQGVFAVNEQTVVLPDAPLTEAACDCRAAGLCVHILAAVLFARQARRPPEAESAGSSQPDTAVIEKELMALAPEMIFKWAGKPSVRQARRLLSHLPREDRRLVPADTSLELVLSPEVRCRYVPGSGLDGIICESAGKRRKAVIAACLLYWWQQRGCEISWPPDSGDGQSRPGPLSKVEKQLTAAFREQLAGMLRAGLMHLPQHGEDALRDLAWSARGGRLPRLSALGLQLVGEMEAFRQGLTGTDSRQVLDLLANLYVLCQALEHSPAEAVENLRGQFRREYQPCNLGPLWMAGAYLYETRSGARGLNLVFWDLESNRPFQLNCGRTGEAARDFDPAAAWQAVLAWRQGRSPQALNNKVVRLENARVSPDSRLSLSAETVLHSVSDMADAIQAVSSAGFSDWRLLSRHWAAALQEPQPILQPVLIRPRRTEPLVLNDIAQCWTGRAQDQTGQWLRLTLPVGDRHNKRAAAFNKCIEAAPADIRGLVLEPRLGRQALQLSPVSLVVKSKSGLIAVHPDLESASIKQRSKVTNLVKRLTTHRYEKAPAERPEPPYGAALENTIAQIQDRILGAAEVGLDCNYLDREQAAAFAQILESLGARRLAGLVDRLGRRRDHVTLIQAHYAFLLAVRQLQIYSLTGSDQPVE